MKRRRLLSRGALRPKRPDSSFNLGTDSDEDPKPSGPRESSGKGVGNARDRAGRS